MDFDFRILRPSDVTGRYVNWFSDPEVTRYSENRFNTFSPEGQRRYVEEKQASETSFLYGIFVDGTHVGNVHLGPISMVHRHSEITFVLGERDYWGMGLMTQAIGRMIFLAFSTFDLKKVYAGTYENNIASMRTLEKNGFVLEGRRVEHLVFEGQRVDMLEYGLVRDDLVA